MTETSTEEKHNIIDDLLPFKKPIDDVHINPINSLIHNDPEIEAMAAGLVEFGQRMPIYINKTNNQVTAGNKRFLAAKKLGWTHIAAVGTEDDLLSAVRFGLSDNLLSRQSSWELKNVSEMVKTMGADGETIPGMTSEIFKDWTESNPIGPDAPPEDWQEFDENMETEHTCPKCGFAFSDR